MFANINDVKKYVELLVNKNQSGSLNGNEISLALNVAQQQYLRIKLGLPETFTVEKREAPQQFQVAQTISDSCRPFIVSTNVTKSGQGFNVPSNFAAWASESFLEVTQVDGVNVAKHRGVEFVTLGERSIRLDDYINYPTVEYPIATYLDNQILVNPDDITMVNLQYVRYPTTPVWAFTVNSDDQEVYDAANSVDLEFPNADWLPIANIAIKYYSIFLRDEFTFGASDAMIKQGQ